MRVWPETSYPLGATWDGKGVNSALFSEHATQVELCLFDSIDAGASLCSSAPRLHPSPRQPTPVPQPRALAAQGGRHCRASSAG
jgi:pullulanase/glycogen debranching enzyme